MHSPPFPRYLVPPRSKYSPQHHILKHHQIDLYIYIYIYIHTHTHTHTLTYSMVHSPSWEANWFAVSQEIPLTSRNPNVHYRTHKGHPACERFWTWMFYREGLSAPSPTPMLEDHTSSAVRDCSFNLHAATLHIGGRSTIHNMRTRHAVVTVTHSMGYIYKIYLFIYLTAIGLSPGDSGY